MDWEAHIEQWSRASVRLLDIRRLRLENGAIPERYVAPAGFFVVTTHGEARLSLSGTVYRARPLHVLHGGKESELILTPTGGEFACYLILYQADSASPKGRDSFRMPYAFTPYALLPLQEKCQTMHRLWRQGTPMDKLEAQSAFLPFVHEIMRQIRAAAAEDGRPQGVTEAIRYIHERYKESITAEVLAGIYGCSASYFSRLFKNQIGVGPIEYLIHVRLDKSKHYLTRTEARIQEVARSVGYEDVYYFSRLFKKHTGRSPLRYREDHRRTVQDNPSRPLKSSIVSPKPVSHNENEIYSQYGREGDSSMFGFSRPAFGAMMLLCTSLILSACQAGNQAETPASQLGTASAAKDSGTGETRIYKHLKGETEIPAKPRRVISLFHLGELMALGAKPVGATTFILKNPLLSGISDIEDVGDRDDRTLRGGGRGRVRSAKPGRADHRRGAVQRSDQGCRDVRRYSRQAGGSAAME